MSTKHPNSEDSESQVIQWITNAGIANGAKKVNLVKKIIEVLLHQIPDSIPLYIETILSYVFENNIRVIKHVVAFIEEISVHHSEYLPKCVGQLRLLLIDSVAAVQKRAIQAASIVFGNALIWICKSNADLASIQFVWDHISEIKLLILNMIDNDNEGIRTHSIKFLEQVVLLQTSTGVRNETFSLDNMPSHLPFLNCGKLERESEHIFELLIKFHNSQHISSINLMACMTTLCILAKARPMYMQRVVQALGDLHTTLPPTLSKSQVHSVRKHLKMQLLSLIKHPSSNEMIPHLTQLLVAIGMTPQEINRYMPKNLRNKRFSEIRNVDIPAKRIRIDSPQRNIHSNESNNPSDFNSDNTEQKVITKANVTEDILFEGLNRVDNVVSLITTTFLNSNIPSQIPSNFIATYKSTHSSIKAQKRHLAKTLLALIKEIPITSAPQNLSEIAIKVPTIQDKESRSTLKNAVAKLQECVVTDSDNESTVSKSLKDTKQKYVKEEKKASEKEKLVPPPTPTIPKLKQKVTMLKLQQLTRPLPNELKWQLTLKGVTRILYAEKESAIGGAAPIWTKFITTYASRYTMEIRDLVLNYVLEDPVNRINFVLSWLYEEYAIMQGYNLSPATVNNTNEKNDQNYNQLLCSTVIQICERGDAMMESNKDVLIRKIYLESPLITDEAVDYLRNLIFRDKMAHLALDLLEELSLMRPPRAHKFVASLVCHVLNEKEHIRDTALKSSIKIYHQSTEAAKRVIEKQALLYLGFISLSTPPPEVRSSRHYRVWTDDLYKQCLNLVLALLPENEELIIEVARVYGLAGSDGKRAVLRFAEGTLRTIAAAPIPRSQTEDNDCDTLRPAFRELLDECPYGAETLLTKLIHILTEKAPPSKELVSRVRQLYATRVSDVRFLIPVLTGLNKKEILAALPKLITLNPNVVKEVLNKLLGLQNPNEECSPVSPEELLVALHLIDTNMADVKYVIKATASCFAAKTVYTKEVISDVLERLLEEEEIPVLLMRSLLQALSLYPSLEPLAQNILRRLIEKKIWTNKVAWEGWIKCCERFCSNPGDLLRSLPLQALPSLPPSLCHILQITEKVSSTEPLPPGMD